MTVEQAVYNIRHAQYGEEVRESIAEGIETIDQDVTAQNLEAEAWAVGTRNGEPVPTTDPAYHNNAKYHAENTDVHKDGNYPEMTVGTAEQLESTVMTEDKAPYVFRTSGGTADIGNREYDTLVGGSVAFNQLCPLASSGFFYNSGLTSLTFDTNEKTTMFKSASASGQAYFGQNVVGGHRLLVTFEIVELAEERGFFLQKDSSTDYTWQFTQIGKVAKIFTPSSYWSIKNYANTGNDTVLKNLMCFDLTQMFGSSIADYIYSLETATPGAGVAYFRKLFPKPYYPYNAGTLIHVNASAHKTVGFNQWDEQTELGTIDENTGLNVSGSSNLRSKNYIAVVPNTSYYFKSPSNMRVFEYNAAKTFIKVNYAFSNNTLQLQDNTYYLRFFLIQGYGTTYKHDICINLSWSGTRNGEYEPYESHTYPLDSDLVLRGIPKLDANNKLYYDGDTYAADGIVTRRYLEKTDYGIIEWTAPKFSISGFSGKEVPASPTAMPNVIVAGYQTVPYQTFVSAATGKLISIIPSGYQYAGALMILDSNCSNVEQMKTALNNRPICVKLATPTTESADPFASPQIVDGWGTEEYVVTEQSGVAMPVGHVTKYPQNLRDKLQHLPNLAPADGDYIVRQTGTQMVLVEPDNALSDTSKNAVQNKVVKAALTLKADKTDVDTADAELERQILASFPTDSISNQPIASFADGADGIPVKSLTVNITPVQDLHGYDNPWPAGGGSNVWDEEWEISGAHIQSKNFIQVNPSTQYYWNAPVQPANGLRFYDSDKNQISVSYYVENNIIITPANCYYIKFALPDAYGTTYNHNISINYPKTIYTYSPYSNICPISGWTGANIERTGENLFEYSMLEDGGINTSTGADVAAPGLKRTNTYIDIESNTVYYIKNRNGVRVFYYQSNNTFVDSYLVSTGGGSFTTPANCAKIRLAGNKNGFYDGMILGISKTYSVSWQTEAGTVYRGTLTDNGDGTWTLTNTHKIMDMGGLTYGYSSSPKRFYVYGFSENNGATANASTAKGIMSSQYVAFPFSSQFDADINDNKICINGGYLFVTDSRYTSANNFKTAVTGVQLLFRLATPLTYTLTTETVKTLLGNNNIFADTGDVNTLAYRADPTLYINKVNQTAIGDAIGGSY